MTEQSLTPKALEPQLATPLKNTNVKEINPVKLVVAVHHAYEVLDVICTQDNKPLVPDAKVGFLLSAVQCTQFPNCRH